MSIELNDRSPCLYVLIGISMACKIANPQPRLISTSSVPTVMVVLA